MKPNEGKKTNESNGKKSGFDSDELVLEISFNLRGSTCFYQGKQLQQIHYRRCLDTLQKRYQLGCQDSSHRLELRKKHYECFDQLAPVIEGSSELTCPLGSCVKISS
jgi:hypothetical protein